jgi:multidrug efflux pump subunit AcrB
MNEGTPSSQTHEAIRKVQEGLWKVDAEVSESNDVESGAVVSSLLSFAQGETSGQIIAELVKEENAVIDGPETMRRWRDAVGQIPGVKQLGFRGASGPGGGPSISIQLIGPDIDQIGRAANELQRRIEQYEGVYDIRNSYERGRPEIKLNIRPEAESLGLTLQDLAQQVRAGFYGAEVQRIQRGQDEVKVMVRFPKDERDSVGYLDNMRIRTPGGGRVPFHAVAEMELAETPLFIQRFDRERAARLTAEVDKEKYEPEKILNDIMSKELPQVLAQFPGVRSRLSGASQRAREAQGELAQGALLSLFLIFALIAVPLRSYSQPLIIMSVIPFGFIGAMLGHWILDIPVSMPSFFGIIALSGVVVNDSLILVDFVNKERKVGVPLAQAVMDGSRVRFRPILLTSLTTFLGLAPITLFEQSLQAQLVIPMAASLAFGIVFATIITLILIPALYLILDDFKGGLRRFWLSLMPWRRSNQRHPHPSALRMRQSGD